jgi:hypothetical protein
MVRASVLAFVCACALAQASSFGQLIYEPVQPEREDYYYGKHDPRTFFFQYRLEQYEEFGHSGLQPFIGGGFDTEMFDADHRRGYWPFGDRPFHRVDLPFPGADPIKGWTPGPWRDPRSGQAPLYFRKQDLLDSATQQADGSWLVPSRPTYAPAPRGETRTAAAPTTRPAPKPRIIIIPKQPRPAAPAEASDKLVAAAK